MFYQLLLTILGNISEFVLQNFSPPINNSTKMLKSTVCVTLSTF